ncbi:MAG: phaG [Ramlibacter sp.]|jgi:multicomponent K+:H+ antiporter subunit G|nr:phaG [Ramlibacter sp.]
MTPVADAIVAVLLLASGIVVLVSAIGLLRLPDFFVRMHAPSLAYTLGTWTATLATIINFSAHQGVLSLSAWLVIVLLSITAPVTTVFLARAAIFRLRAAGEDVPPPLVATPHQDLPKG